MYLPATFVQRLRVRTASGSDRIIFHLSFDIFDLLFDGPSRALLRKLSKFLADGPVATARGSDTCVALTRFSIRQFVSQENQQRSRTNAPLEPHTFGGGPSMQKVAYLICSFLILIAMTVTVALAQGTTSRVTGTVLDPKGAAVPGAAVTLTNEATKISFNTETTSSGTYAFDAVQVGLYTVLVEKTGFKKFVSANNKLDVNQPATVNVNLEVGDLNEVVQVTAAAEAVQTSSSGNFGQTVEQRSLETLPIVGTRGRNPLTFVNLQPGVVVGANI